MNDIEKYDFNGSEIRVVKGEDGEPWFVASDVAKVLGYRMASDMTRSVDEEDKSSTQIVRTGNHSGGSAPTIISEAGLYQAILSSRVEGAREFKRWVTREVLPSIRKHGAYMTEGTMTEMLQCPENMITLVETLQREQQARIAAESALSEAKPKADTFDVISSGTQLRTLDQAAKALNGMTKQTMIDLMLAHNLVYRAPAYVGLNGEDCKDAIVPRAEYKDCFEVSERVSKRWDKQSRQYVNTVSLRLMVKPKGYEVMVAKFGIGTEDEILGISEAARLVKKSTTVITRMTDDGLIPYIETKPKTVGAGRRRYVRASEVIEAASRL